MKHTTHTFQWRFKSIKIYLALLISLISMVFNACKKDIHSIESSSALSIDLLATGKPNIILIIGDDVGYDIPTFNGGESYETPNLDFMAFNGVYFPNCFAMPDGPPARIELMTGKYSCRNFTEARHLNPEDKTIGNMLRDAGYSTGYVGKWHLDGGDTSIKNHGFDKYLVFMPYNPKTTGYDQWYRRYKNPLLYQNGAYLPDSVVEGKYSEDLYNTYINNFIDSNKSKPFFLIYSCNLVQHPWSPTPDDPDFANWDASGDERSREDVKYFPGMVKYMDKMIGKLMDKISETGLTSKTVVMFTSDNGTVPGIKSVYKGDTVRGGKLDTKRTSINVPLAVYGPGNVVSGIMDTSIIDMTDFLTSFAGIAKIPVPTTWGKLDGKTFNDNLQGNIVATKQKSYYYTFWPTDFDAPNNTTSFIFDYNYKLYDSAHGGQFYNIRLDVNEKNPIDDDDLTNAERKIKSSFNAILKKGYSIAGY
ncbi:sulfatase-like hydrolase/transferase [Panacibacter ginsenosidivorans]|uniref:Sulfatase-like hydrolase/transferase n=1 Tax=Panacibacter ginsenosidivorans TaxID=1813871 RepID=A0A5B8V5F2_9BACT|nr:sulfatase-like hydrolase/transferase [Panacibacter ginsenosidivorans]QEC66614.1 sulfatase-like hydrolase/transferase [Panacibacter ginsenosidivorans]